MAMWMTTDGDGHSISRRGAGAATMMPMMMLMLMVMAMLMTMRVMPLMTMLTLRVQPPGGSAATSHTYKRAADRARSTPRQPPAATARPRQGGDG